MDTKIKPTRSMIEGAVRYAAADRSDPFAYNRAMSHSHNGVASRRANEKDDRHGHYDADRVIVEKTFTNTRGEAETYKAEEYQNRVCP